MISLDIEQTCLLELLKASLFGVTPVIPKDVNWEKVLELAVSQCIVPLVVSFVPEEHKNEVIEISYRNKAHYMQLMHEQNDLVNIFNDNKIPFVIIKGTAASVYYPNPSLRTFGDIDLYISEDNIKFANALLRNQGYHLIGENYRHYGYYKNGIEFELHKRISSIRYNNIDTVFIIGLNNAVESKIGEYSFPCFPKYENGLVLLGHMMQHLTSGIGFRQIIDWMMFVHKELDDSSWKENFNMVAREAGLERLAITVTYMCRKWMGLPNNITWCNSADEEVVDQLLLRVLEDGNFGRSRNPVERVKGSIVKEGIFKYLQRKGTTSWLLAKRHPSLRPFAWLYQLCRYARKGLVGIFTGKKMIMKNKEQMSLEELWKRLE